MMSVTDLPRSFYRVHLMPTLCFDEVRGGATHVYPKTFESLNHLESSRNSSRKAGDDEMAAAAIKKMAMR